MRSVHALRDLGVPYTTAPPPPERGEGAAVSRMGVRGLRLLANDTPTTRVVVEQRLIIIDSVSVLQ